MRMARTKNLTCVITRDIRSVDAASCGAVSHVTLTDYCIHSTGGDRRYLHLFDGGDIDNLGLVAVESVLRTIWDDFVSATGPRPERAFVLAVRAFVRFELREIKHVDPDLWSARDGGGVSNIPTRFAIRSDHSALLQQAAKILVKRNIRDLCAAHSRLCGPTWRDVVALE